jgi:hypothetical protein
MIMVSIGEIRALAYRKGCRVDRTTAPAKWRLETARGALSSAPLGYRDAFVVLMGMPDVQR